MWNYVERGGPVMWPLLALSVLGLTVMIWRWWALRRATSGVATLMKALRTALRDGDIPAAIAITVTGSSRPTRRSR